MVNNKIGSQNSHEELSYLSLDFLSQMRDLLTSYVFVEVIDMNTNSFFESTTLNSQHMHTYVATYVP